MRRYHTLIVAMIGVFLANGVFASALEEVDALVRAEMARQKAPGVAIAIVSKGEVLAAKGYGLANVEHNVAVTERTIFQSGSVGKQFTATAVMLLVENGKIALDDSITKYFSDAPAAWQQVTVRHLLTHTSGIPNYTDSAMDYRRDLSEDQHVQMAYELKLEFEPGTRWSYSNTGYVLLGVLIHKVSGHFYGDVLAERVFAPLGMKTALVISEADIVPNRAAGYRTVDGELKNQEWVAPALNTTADGALYLTVLDMIAWDRGLRAGAILKPASWEQVYTPVRLKSGKTYPYGFGWDVEGVAGQPVHRHGGSWQGFTSGIARYVGIDLTVIVFANHGAFGSGSLASAIAGKVDARVAEPERKPIADQEPEVTARVRTLLSDTQKGKLSEKDFRHMPGGWWPKDGYRELFQPLGELRRLDLIRRRDLGDDRAYEYEAVYATQTLVVTFWLAIDNEISAFVLWPK
jgi:CubicO group peptidase (beta-lactamase class C family)